MRPLARWAALPLLTAPFTTWALGLGEIELHSALNQPFDAEIGLSATPEELAGLRVSLAPLATFQRAGIDRPNFLSNFSFRIGRNDAGENVIIVRSNQSIAEPFVTMIVEAAYAGGLRLREYTVLLDPPVLLPVPPAPAVVEPPRARPSEAAPAGGAIQRPPQQPAAAPPPAPVSQPPVSQQRPPAAQPVQPTPPPPPPVGGTYGPVQNGETLWRIATNYRPNGVTMNQMLVALFEANPQAFNRANMNQLRRGAILRIPELSELQGVTAAGATAEVQRQTDEWRGEPQQPRLILVPPSEDEPALIGAGGGAEVAEAEAEIAPPRAQASDLEGEAEENERLLTVRDEALSELQNELAAGPEPVESGEPDVAETDTAAAVATAGGDDFQSEQLFADEPAETEPAVEPEPEPEVSAPTPAPTPAPSAGVAPRAPTLVDRIIGYASEPFVWIGLGVVVVLIAALLFLRRRREDIEDVTGQWEALEAEIDDEEVSREATTRMREQALAEDEDFLVVEQQGREATERGEPAEGADPLSEYPTGTFAVPESELADQTLSSQTVINLDQADPVAEADFHMAYGLYDQAADLVSKALEAAPGNRELELKLLEVYFVWGNKESFVAAAQQLRSEMGAQPDADWDKVIIMGKQICPDEALFADATAAAGEVDLDLEAGDEPALDLALGDEDYADTDVPDVDLDLGDIAGGDVELELESPTGQHRRAGGAEKTASADDAEILDIGAQTSAGLEAALFEATDASGAETSPDVEFDSLAATQESPTIETKKGDLGSDDWSEDVTMESPTVETTGPEAPTVESSALAPEEQPTLETPTIETAGPDTTEQPVFEEQEFATAELTAELDLDDLGLDVADVDSLADDLGDLPIADDAESDTREQPAMAQEDDDLLSATGVTQVLSGDDDDLEHISTAVIGDEDATMMAPGFRDDPTLVSTEVLQKPDVDLEHTAEQEGLDLDLDDFSAALEGGGDTVEQPQSSSADVFGSRGRTPVDLDIGTNVVGDDDPTGTDVSPLDAQTMTEVGTKLDLARAYIDMGDPEGARSILQEVLDEGDSGQRREAQSLIDALPA